MIKVNGQEIKLTKFPNGETLVDTTYLNNLSGDVDIHFKWTDDSDIIHLCFVLDHIYQPEIHNLVLYVYYMPYSRMDRSENGSCFTLETIAQILNEFVIFCDEVWILEPHSDMTTKLIKDSHRFNVITPLMNYILEKENIDVICYPDKGARNRFANDDVSLPIVYCNKVRDFDTGEIKGLELVTDEDLTGKNILVLDDLCSKGGTFYHVANRLKEAGANEIILGCCHMEDTVMKGKIWTDGTGNLNTPIKHIYCLDTMLKDNNVAKLGNNITVFNTEKVIDSLTFEDVLEEEKCLLNL